MRFSPLVRYLVCAGLLVCLGLAGCRTSPRYRRESALLRAEILDVEDKYAMLKAKYLRVARELSELTGEPVDMDLGAGPTTSFPLEDTIYLAPGEVLEEQLMYPSPALTDPAATLPEAAPVESGSEPSILQDPVPGESPAPTTDEGSSTKLFLSGTSRSRYASGNRVTEVRIHPSASGGHSVDGQAGDEGLRLLVQPRTSKGQVELQPGELTVSLIEPGAGAGARRIGLWKFVAEETELFFVNDERNQEGILLRLPWREQPPSQNRIVAHVRLVTPDGRVLRSSREIRITPPAAGYNPDAPAIEEWILQGRPPADGNLVASQTGVEGAERLISPSPRQRNGNRQPGAPQWRPVR